MAVPTVTSPRARRIIELARRGLSRREIHEQVGGKINGVSQTLHAARRAGLIPPPTYDCPLPISRSMEAALKAEAAARGISYIELGRKILTAVVDGGIIDAVLDGD